MVTVEALDHLKTNQTIWIAGGGEIYKQMLANVANFTLPVCIAA